MRKKSNNLLYYVIYGIAYFFSLLPYCFLEILTQISAFLLYSIFRYRRKVVRENLKKSFPEKKILWITRTERIFYHHFCRQLFESFKLLSLSNKKALQHIEFEGLDVIEQLRTKGHQNCILTMGHFGAWDYFCASSLILSPMDIELHQVYRPLHNDTVDRLMYKIRTRFGAHCIPQELTLRAVLKMKEACQKDKNLFNLLILIADPSPAWMQIKFFTQFLHQPTAFVVGPEMIAKKTKIPVVYMDIIRLKKRKYKGVIKLLSENPEESTDFLITRMFVYELEKTIRRNPAYWLWSHRRWKADPKVFFRLPHYPPVDLHQS